MSMLIKVAEYLTPVLKESKFKETGVLTPEEFVLAGDYLVHHCPSWQWKKGDSSALKPYLPEYKQFLLTEKVPCFKRWKELEDMKFNEQIIDSNDGEGGWVDARVTNEQKDEVVEVAEEATEQSLVDCTANLNINKHDNDDEDNDSEAEDINDWINKEGLLDEYYQCTPDLKTLRILEAQRLNMKIEDEDNIVLPRRYDLYISYDKYYQTPRLWLMGFDEYLKELTPTLLFEDISEEHANKTVTMENFPHVKHMRMASIHPCRHAEMMKKIISTMEYNDKELTVDRYLVIFLKFVQTVIPTIQSDYTQKITL